MAVTEFIRLWRERDGAWEVIRRLPFDNAGALAGLVADGLRPRDSVRGS